MDVIADKNKKTKKFRIITSILIILFSIILLAYAIINNEPIAIIVALILIIKIFDIALNFHKIRRRSYRPNA